MAHKWLLIPDRETQNIGRSNSMTCCHEYVGWFERVGWAGRVGSRSVEGGYRFQSTTPSPLPTAAMAASTTNSTVGEPYVRTVPASPAPSAPTPNTPK